MKFILKKVYIYKPDRSRMQRYDAKRAIKKQYFVQTNISFVHMVGIHKKLLSNSSFFFLQSAFTKIIFIVLHQHDPCGSRYVVFSIYFSFPYHPMYSLLLFKFSLSYLMVFAKYIFMMCIHKSCNNLFICYSVFYNH